MNFYSGNLATDLLPSRVGPTVKVLAARPASWGSRSSTLKMGYKPDLSDLGAPNSVNRVRHLRLGVGEKITAPDGKESRIRIHDTWNTDMVVEAVRSGSRLAR
jgi:hypothetical protein